MCMVAGDDVGLTQTTGCSAGDVPHPDTIATRLKLVRETAGLSQRELAKRAGVTNSGISMIELGQVSPSVLSLERILSAFPLSLSDFLRFNIIPATRITHADVRPELPSAHGLNSCFLNIPAHQSNTLSLMEEDACGLVFRGRMCLQLIASNVCLHEGDSFFIPAGELHQFVNPGESPLRVFICSISKRLR